MKLYRYRQHVNGEVSVLDVFDSKKDADEIPASTSPYLGEGQPIEDWLPTYPIGTLITGKNRGSGRVLWGIVREERLARSLEYKIDGFQREPNDWKPRTNLVDARTAYRIRLHAILDRDIECPDDGSCQPKDAAFFVGDPDSETPATEALLQSDVVLSIPCADQAHTIAVAIGQDAHFDYHKVEPGKEWPTGAYASRHMAVVLPRTPT